MVAAKLELITDEHNLLLSEMAALDDAVDGEFSLKAIYEAQIEEMAAEIHDLEQVFDRDGKKEKQIHNEFTTMKDELARYRAELAQCTHNLLGWEEECQKHADLHRATQGELYSAKLETLDKQQELQQLHTELHKLQSQLADTQKEQELTTQQLSSAEEKAVKADSMVGQVQNERDLLQRELDSLKLDIEDTNEFGLEYADSMQALYKEEIKDLNAEILTLQTGMLHMKSHKQQQDARVSQVC